MSGGHKTKQTAQSQGVLEETQKNKTKKSWC
jgi:hypothetical protein